MTDTATKTYAPGTPIWVDLASPDIAGSVSFYGQLFGWNAQDLGEEAGHYNMFTQGGKQVAAVAGKMDPGQPTAWSVYVKTDNAAETVKKAAEAGGKVLMEPFAVMDQGTMAVVADPSGAVISLWQPDKMSGAELFNTPNSFSWSELHTRDITGSRDFYTKVFPWAAQVNAMPGAGEYTEWQVDGRSIGGGMAMGPEMPASVPPHWLVYFTVANTDDTVKRAQELGGTVMAPAMDIPQGRFAILVDPQGAAFGIIQNA
jgi:predicted enzyme related to lactoylglutathione lyase